MMPTIPDVPDVPDFFQRKLESMMSARPVGGIGGRNMLRNIAIVGSLVFAALYGPVAKAAPNDIKASPILNLNNGISFELIDSIKAKQVPVDQMFVMFTEEDQKHLPIRHDFHFTPLCAAAHGQQLRAVRELIALGADVNSPCVQNQYITNPLQLAYMDVALQNKETDVTRALKAASADVSAAWKDWAANDQAMTTYRTEEARRQAMENMQLLGSIAVQVVQGATSAKSSINARSLGDLLVATTNNVSSGYQDELARRPDDPVLVKLLQSMRKTPTNKNVHAFFPSLNEGKAWCAGTQPQYLVISALRTANATLQNMIPCRCEKTAPNPEGMPFVCGVTYADTVRK